MPLARDRCICVRKVEYSETSQILSLFSRDHGIFRAIAKGAHRRTKAGASRFDGGIDLLDLGEAVFTHDPAREMSTLTDWHLLDGHLELRGNLRAVYLGQYAAELTLSMLEEHDAHPDLFDRVEHIFRELSSPRIEEAFFAFQLDLLRAAGYLPEMTACVSCGQAVNPAGNIQISASRGGVICTTCNGHASDRITLDARLFRLVQQILKLPRIDGIPQRLPRLTRHQTNPLNALLARHVQHTLSKPLRLAGYVLG